MAFAAVGKAGVLGTVTSGLFQGFIENIISSRCKLLGDVVGIISAFSSIGGIIALILDYMDFKGDGWISLPTIKVV